MSHPMTNKTERRNQIRLFEALEETMKYRASLDKRRLGICPSIQKHYVTHILEIDRKLGVQT